MGVPRDGHVPESARWPWSRMAFPPFRPRPRDSGGVDQRAARVRDMGGTGMGGEGGGYRIGAGDPVVIPLMADRLCPPLPPGSPVFPGVNAVGSCPVLWRRASFWTGVHQLLDGKFCRRIADKSNHCRTAAITPP